MICPLASTVDEVLQHPAAIDLISADARAGVAALARRLPDAMHGFGFELRLQPWSAGVDFYTSIAAQGGGRERWTLAQPWLPDVSPADAAAWDRVRMFAGRWSDRTSPLHSRVQMVFMEFDAPVERMRAPSIFARLDAAVGDGRQQWVQAAPAVDELALLLLGQPVQAATRAMLGAAFAALPSGGRVIDVAVMVPRGQAAVRLFVSVPRAQLAGYLAALDWIDEGGALERMMDTLFGRCAHVSLPLDVGPRVGPRIGIALSPAWVAEDGDGDDWTAIGHRLVGLGLSTDEQAAALGRWPGRGAPLAIAGRWPSQAVRLISHVKVVLEPSRPIVAKAYLWVTRRFATLS